MTLLKSYKSVCFENCTLSKLYLYILLAGRSHIGFMHNENWLFQQ